VGNEPNNISTLLYVSDDIWIRNQQDGLTNQTTQTPEHSSTNDPAQLNYVYVRVRNNGCEPTIGTETLNLHWAKASTALDWPAYWDGSTFLDPPTNTALAGNFLSSAVIPVIAPGGETILEIAWNPPNPAIYTAIGNPDPWHFCLLSNIVVEDDPTTDYIPVWLFVKRNNNVVWKNFNVVDNIVGFTGGGGGDCGIDLMQNIGVVTAIVNTNDMARTYDLQFKVPADEVQSPITTSACVTIAMDDDLYNKWKQGGRQGSGFKEVKTPSMPGYGQVNQSINDHAPIVVSDRNFFEIESTDCVFKNIELDAKQVTSVSLMVTYPVVPVLEKESYLYDVIQVDNSTGEMLGGNRFGINRPTGAIESANAGSDRTINRNCNTLLTGSPVRDCNVYFWLNEQGKIIGEEAALVVSPQHTTTYTLKVITPEGFILIDEVTVTVTNQQCQKKRFINNVSPNPVGALAQVDYEVEDVTDAKIRIVKTDNSFDVTYDLDETLEQINVNLTNCTCGAYVVILICDGVVEDNKTIIVQ
jgi:hypothetical protein